MRSYLFLSALSLTMLLHATPEDYAQQAEHFYRQGNYAEAVQVYQQIKERSSCTWYNMGHCYYQLGDVVHAMACWWQADKNASLMQRMKNREQRAVIDPMAGGMHGGWYSYATDLIASIPYLILQGALLISWYLLFILVFLILKRYITPIIFFPTFILFGIITIFCGWALIIHYQINRGDNRCVTRENTVIRAGPSEHYHAVSSLKKADSGVITSQTSSWYKVKFCNNYVGWIPKSAVLVIE